MAASDPVRFRTLAVHAGTEPDPTTGAVMTPIYQTSTFIQEAPGVHKGYEYSRAGNPTRTALEAAVAQLEGAAWGLAFASGCAATDAVMRLLSPGDHVVAGNDLYGGTYRLFQRIIAQTGVRFTYVDSSDVAATRAAIVPGTRLVWVESPSNPLLRVTDLAAVAEAAHRVGALCVCDNTFATPLIQRPLALGCDLSVHSTTKYLGGHSDVIGGAICGNDRTLRDGLHFLQKAVGAVPGPMDCFLVLRGIKTLALRMERHSANAEIVARHLAGHPKVRKVFYPGLPGAAGHDVARRQMSLFGGMVSFEAATDEAGARRLTTRTRLFLLAESLGGVESLINHPATMTHASVPPEERRKAGLSDGLLRLSVGIEDPEDLVADLDRALGEV